MFCARCGKELNGNEQFCANCGYKTVVKGSQASEGASELHSTGISTIDRIHKQAKHIGLIRFICGVVAIVVVITIAINLLKPSYIDQVKGGTIYAYDYGIPIEDALHNWFNGTETWDSYKDGDTFYVTASGWSEYSLYDGGENQYFLFEIMDDEKFSFLGAYTSDGSRIFENYADSWGEASAGFYNNLLSLYGTSLYDAAVEAAFGSEEMLQNFEEDSY